MSEDRIELVKDGFPDANRHSLHDAFNDSARGILPGHHLRQVSLRLLGQLVVWHEKTVLGNFVKSVIRFRYRHGANRLGERRDMDAKPV